MVRADTGVGRLMAAVSILICSAAIVPGPVLGAELHARTVRAYEEYLVRASRAFLSRESHDDPPGPPRGGVISAGPAREDGIIGVPGGLVHNWTATSFIRGVGLPQVLAQSRAYQEYPRTHKAVMASQVLEHDNDRYRLLMRIKEGAAGITGVLQIRSSVVYSYPTKDSALVVATADEIREVKNAGGHDERLLPAGNDSGYLWRANTFTRYVERADGVWIEMETLGLSRRFPPLLGWLIEPIARRLGRRSVETTLQEVQAAVEKRHAR